MKKLLYSLPIIIYVAIIAGCGGGGGSSSTISPPPGGTPVPSISLDKSSVTMHPGSSINVIARGTGGVSGDSIIWSTESALILSFSEVDATSSTYHIAASDDCALGDYVVSVTSPTCNPVKITVHVTAEDNSEPPATLTLDKTSISLYPGESATVVATGSDSSIGTIIWGGDSAVVVTPQSSTATSSTCLISVPITAPAGTYSVFVAGSSLLNAQCSVTVLQPTITVTPDSGTVTVGHYPSFTATCKGISGSDLSISDDNFYVTWDITKVGADYMNFHVRSGGGFRGSSTLYVYSRSIPGVRSADIQITVQ